MLQQALGDQYVGPMDELPDGQNSFFRQLDYMIATVASEEFRELYRVCVPTSFSSVMHAHTHTYTHVDMHARTRKCARAHTHTDRRLVVI